MKMIFCFVAAFFAAQSLFADTEDVDGIVWTYSVIDGKAVIQNGRSPAIPASTTGAITIPSSLGGCPVSSIGSNAFNACSGLKSVTMPSTITSIGSSAFSGCVGLSSFTMPDSVTSIGSFAFSGCSSLTNVVLPSSLMKIDGYAFGSCSNLVRVCISDLAAWCRMSFSNLYANPLYYAHNLYVKEKLITDLMIPNTITNICGFGFSGCRGLSSVNIPDSVVSIGDSAFAGCSGLMSLTIPNSVTKIEDSAFSGCSGLVQVSIPASLLRVGKYAFVGCESLTAISVAADNPAYCSVDGLLLSKDGKTLIQGVNGEVKIPCSVTNIADSAFSGCSGLTSVTIPSSVVDIGRTAFCGCNGLDAILVASNNPAYSSVEGLLLTKDGKVLVQGVNGNLTVPNSVECIGPFAFGGRSELTNITIRDSVKAIAVAAFVGCGGLTSVTIPSSVTNIGDRAFTGCINLAHVVIPDSVVHIGADAFLDTPFYNAQPDGLVVFGSVGYKYKGKCPAAVTIPDGVATIGWSAFAGCTNLMGVTMPSSVRSVEKWAFSDCFGLTQLTISDSIKYIEDHAFYNCSGLTALRIPTSVTCIGDSAFASCSGLTNLIIGASVANIGSSAFSGCSGLGDVTIPGSVTTIGRSAFSGCTGLTNVVMIGDCPKIGANAFLLHSMSSARTRRMPHTQRFSGTNPSRKPRKYMNFSCVVQLPEGNATYHVKDGQWQYHQVTDGFWQGLKVANPSRAQGLNQEQDDGIDAP